jgi:hypothetical protein
VHHTCRADLNAISHYGLEGRRFEPALILPPGTGIALCTGSLNSSRSPTAPASRFCTPHSRVR